MYSDAVMDHFLHPRNMGVMENPDAEGTVGNPICGDVMKIYIKVTGTGESLIISDITFQTLGCGAAIATSSMVTELVKGKTFIEALKINNQTVADALGGLPDAKLHCSNLAAEGVHAAIDNYRKTHES